MSGIITHGSHYPAPQRESAKRASGSGYSTPRHPTQRPIPHQERGDPRSRSRSRPPVHAACATRDTSPVIGSVMDVCVVTLLPDVVDVIVALCNAGAGAATLVWSWGCLPIADSAGDTSPGLGQTRRRSVEDIELAWASDLRLITVNARECSEAEFETGAEPAALSAECGLKCDRIECGDPCSEMIAGGTG